MAFGFVIAFAAAVFEGGYLGGAMLVNDLGMNESAFDEGPVRRYLFQVTDLPPRMKRLLHSTPGIVGFLPTAPGVAVATEDTR